MRMKMERVWGGAAHGDFRRPALIPILILYSILMDTDHDSGKQQG
jgi:hypothetical protein